MQRRQFLQHSISTLGILSAATELSGAQPTTRKVKVAQIGTAHAHAAGQLQTILKFPDRFEFVGYAEPDPQRAEAVRKQKPYQGQPELTVNEILARRDIAIVAVETEVKDLLPTAQACLTAGFHIHLDKPAGESLAQWKEVLRLAEQKHLLIQMGYMYRYNPAFQFLFAAVHKGWLGRIFEVHGVMSKKVDSATRKQLAKYPGGSMFELGCHLIDPLLALLGTPDNVLPFNRKTIPSDKLLDNTLAVFEYPYATATIRSTLLEVDGGRRRHLTVCGTKGTIRILPLEPPQLELTLEEPQEKFRKGTQKVELPASTGRYDGAWLAFADAFTSQPNINIGFGGYEHDFQVQKAILAASGLIEWNQETLG